MTPTPTILLADFWVAVGGAELALGALERTLNRYSLDYETWVILTRMAIEHDLTHVANDKIQAGFDRLAHGAFIDKLRQDYDASRARSNQYRLLLEQAAEAQNAKRWYEAMGTLDAAIATSRSNTLAHVNRCICLYHLGRTDDLMAAAGALLQGVLHTNERSTTGLLALLAAIATSRNALAVTVASLIARNAPEPMDLPLIPLLAKETETVSRSDTQPILSALNDLESRVESPDAQNALRELTARYKQLTRIIAAP